MHECGLMVRGVFRTPRSAKYCLFLPETPTAPDTLLVDLFPLVAHTAPRRRHLRYRYHERRSTSFAEHVFCEASSEIGLRPTPNGPGEQARGCPYPKGIMVLM